jgi:pimeloyl-ACP methyl ester carboxylesterase
VGARLVTLARPNDEDVRIPANGFSLAATVSKPPAGAGKLPAVILVGGAGLTDRDETSFGVPIFAHLAAAFADARFLVVRYDRRGIGQSGGRPEAARLADFAEDLRAVVKTVGERKDVDRDRVALVGHGEGGWVAMMAASKNKRVGAVALVGTAGVTGEELNLYQVRRGLERSGRPEGERSATIALQEQIHKAVITGTGWDAIKIIEPVRRQADTPYFQSFLTLDPSKVMKDVAQPLLIVHGERDRQVPPTSAERLEALARARKHSPPVDVTRVAGVNHLLVAAETGEVDEYERLPSRQVSPDVTAPVVAWLQRTLRAAR